MDEKFVKGSLGILCTFVMVVVVVCCLVLPQAFLNDFCLCACAFHSILNQGITSNSWHAY
ncbi:hypothetical protein HanXRQr2_Chr06g0260051 [Helianthus annuus]|uniref:Uncharacterized protein n=1 Tax=Helianthus annuus TaxID=4232 RepID=A0A9K3IT19_HELAN|nr:hypothetical protein HanXRQr2_Chr06g0260051 [Helianthus annuus]